MTLLSATRATLLLVTLTAPVVGQQEAPAKREVGNLVFEGVPEIPEELALRMNQYTNVRGAALLDWEPGGGGMLVATRFAETAQVHHVAAPRGDRRQLTFFREPIADAAYDPQRPDSGFYVLMDEGGGEFYQLNWFDRATGRTRLLTDGKSRNESVLVSNAGGAVAFASTRRNGKDFDLYVMEGADASRTRLALQVTGDWNPLDWSADDARLLLLEWISINEARLHVLDLATGDLQQLNPRPDPVAYRAAAFAHGSPGVFYASDEGGEFLRLTYLDVATGRKRVLTPDLGWDVEALAVSLDGRWLAYAVNEGGSHALYLAKAQEPHQPRRIATPAGVLQGLRFDREGRRLGFTLSTAGSPADVYSVDVGTGELTRWTFSEVGGLNPQTFVEPELVEFPSFDGRRIPAWYYRPRADDGPHPVVVAIHGGPEAQATAAFDPHVQYWVNELAAAVLEPNVRGSSGYGKSYLLLDNGLRREDSVKDIGALLDWIVEQPELDAGRVAVIGGSYGGYMVLASMARYDNRICCGVDVVGISNFVTFLENTEEYRRDLRRPEYGDERDPEMRAFLERISPTTNAAGIRKPLFVVQGLNDPRVPVSEAEQIVRTVRGNGGSVWYLLARDEGHGFQKKVNRDALAHATTLFFEQHLLDRVPTAAAGTTAGSR